MMRITNQGRREDVRPYVSGLKDLLRGGRITRRGFIRNATLWGLSLGSVSAFLSGKTRDAAAASHAPVRGGTLRTEYNWIPYVEDPWPGRSFPESRFLLVGRTWPLAGVSRRYRRRAQWRNRRDWGSVRRRYRKHVSGFVAVRSLGGHLPESNPASRAYPSASAKRPADFVPGAGRYRGDCAYPSRRGRVGARLSVAG